MQEIVSECTASEAMRMKESDGERSRNTVTYSFFYGSHYSTVVVCRGVSEISDFRRRDLGGASETFEVSSFSLRAQVFIACR